MYQCMVCGNLIDNLPHNPLEVIFPDIVYVTFLECIICGKTTEYREVI